MSLGVSLILRSFLLVSGCLSNSPEFSPCLWVFVYVSGVSSWSLGVFLRLRSFLLVSGCFSTSPEFSCCYEAANRAAEPADDLYIAYRLLIYALQKLSVGSPPATFHITFYISLLSIPPVSCGQVIVIVSVNLLAVILNRGPNLCKNFERTSRRIFTSWLTTWLHKGLHPYI